MQIFNSYTGRKEEFTPLQPGEVRMYVCGITVYDYCHMGHARVDARRSTWCGAGCATRLHVTYVRNITDIDDKIIKRAAENGEPIRALTDALHRRRCTRTRRARHRCGPTTSRAPREYVPQMHRR